MPNDLSEPEYFIFETHEVESKVCFKQYFGAD